MNMNTTTSFDENMNTLFSDLQNFVKTETVLGTPLAVGDKTLVPVMSVTLGYGSTGMARKAQIDSSNNASNGIGLGAKVTTSAVVVIEKDNVAMLPVAEKSNMGQLIEKIPEAIMNMGQNMKPMGGMQGQTQNQNQNQNQPQSQNQSQTQGQQANQPTATSQSTSSTPQNTTQPKK